MRTDAAKPLLAVMILAIAGVAKGEDSGKICGIGAVVAPDDKLGGAETVVAAYLNIAEIIPGSPSDKSGLQKGDEIIEVDGHSVAGMNFIAVVTKLIRGKEGTPVKITIKRNGQAVPQVFTMIREPVYLPMKH